MRNSRSVPEMGTITGATLSLFCILSVLLCFSGAANAQDSTITNSIGMKLVLIPAGSFMMGSDSNFEECGQNETPRHKIVISNSFYLGQYEVTQEQWVAVMGANPSKFKAKENPVEQISWDEAQLFISNLNKKEGTDRYRLPTEAEWEYACRAGSETPYYFGDDKNSMVKYGWYDANSEAHSHPVGQLEPNAWGLYDMHGNVWEWCLDWYSDKYYEHSPSTDPQGYLPVRIVSGAEAAGSARPHTAVQHPGSA